MTILFRAQPSNCTSYVLNKYFSHKFSPCLSNLPSLSAQVILSSSQQLLASKLYIQVIHLTPTFMFPTPCSMPSYLFQWLGQCLAQSWYNHNWIIIHFHRERCLWVHVSCIFSKMNTLWSLTKKCKSNSKSYPYHWEIYNLFKEIMYIRNEFCKGRVSNVVERYLLEEFRRERNLSWNSLEEFLEERI